MVHVLTVRPGNTVPAPGLVVAQRVLLAVIQVQEPARHRVHCVLLENTVDQAKARALTALLDGMLLLVPRLACIVPLVSMHRRPVQGAVPHVLLEDTQVTDMAHAQLVQVEDIPLQMLVAALIVLPERIRMERARRLHALRVLLEHTREQALVRVQPAPLVVSPSPVLTDALTVPLANTPLPGLVCAPHVPRASTLAQDGAHAIAVLLDGTLVPALVAAQTAVMARIRRLLVEAPVLRALPALTR